MYNKRVKVSHIYTPYTPVLLNPETGEVCVPGQPGLHSETPRSHGERSQMTPLLLCKGLPHLVPTRFPNCRALPPHFCRGGGGSQSFPGQQPQVGQSQSENLPPAG